MLQGTDSFNRFALMGDVITYVPSQQVKVPLRLPIRELLGRCPGPHLN